MKFLVDLVLDESWISQVDPIGLRVWSSVALVMFLIIIIGLLTLLPWGFVKKVQANGMRFFFFVSLIFKLDSVNY